MSTHIPDAAIPPAGDPAAPTWSRAAVREVWRMAWPTVLTMTSYTVMQFVDKLMVAQVGPEELAAQGNGGVWAFNLIAFAMGVLTLVNTFVAQNLGAGTPREGSRYAWAGLWFSGIIWVVALIPFAFALPWVFGAMGHSPRITELETVYGQIMLVGAIVLLANKTMSHYFFGLHRPGVVAVAAIAGNLCNGVLNYTLIYGEQGLPALGLPGVPGVPAYGLVGAGVATVIGTAIELLIPLAIFLSPKMHALFGTRSAWRLDLGALRDLVRLGWPASMQWGSELLCWSIFMSIFVGGFGDDPMAAGWATLTYMHLSFMPAVGFSVAVSALVGRSIGAGRPDVAAARARLGLAMAMIYMTACALVMLVFREPLIAIFVGGDVSPERAARIIAIGGTMMICAAIFQTADAAGVVCTGALRGAGDTVWPGLATIVLSWTFIVGGGWAMLRLAPQLEALGPWIAASAYIIVYGVVMWWRWESGRWRSIRVLSPDRASAAAAAPIVTGPPAGVGGDTAEDLAGDVAREVVAREAER